MQQVHGVGQWHQPQAAAHVVGQGFGDGLRLEFGMDQPPQHRLRQAVDRGVDRREAIGQRVALVHLAQLGVHHLVAKKPAPHLAQRTHAAAFGQRLLGIGVEVDEAQHQLAAFVFDVRHQLAARPELHLAVGDLAFHQYRLAVRRLQYRVEVGFVLVAQRQVQHQVETAGQAQLFQPFGGGGGRHDGLAGDVDGSVHAAIVPNAKRDGTSHPVLITARPLAGRQANRAQRAYWRSQVWVRPSRARPRKPRTSSFLPPSASLALAL